MTKSKESDKNVFPAAFKQGDENLYFADFMIPPLTIPMPNGLDDEEMSQEIKHQRRNLHVGGQIQFCHANGKTLVGPYLNYKENGTGDFYVCEAGRNKDGKPDGPVTLYGTNGQVTGRLNYKMGKKEGLFRYYTDGMLIKAECWKNNHLEPKLTKKMERNRRLLEWQDFALMQLVKVGDLLRGEILRTPEDHYAWRENKLMAKYNAAITPCAFAENKKSKPVGLGQITIVSTASPKGTLPMKAHH